MEWQPGSLFQTLISSRLSLDHTSLLPCGTQEPSSIQAEQEEMWSSLLSPPWTPKMVSAPPSDAFSASSSISTGVNKIHLSLWVSRKVFSFYKSKGTWDRAMSEHRNLPPAWHLRIIQGEEVAFSVPIHQRSWFTPAEDVARGVHGHGCWTRLLSSANKCANSITQHRLWQGSCWHLRKVRRYLYFLLIKSKMRKSPLSSCAPTATTLAWASWSLGICVGVCSQWLTT